MRHKYHTRAVVLARQPLGEANALVTVLTEDLGLIRARAQGIRKPGAKLAPALTTFAESELMLVKGSEGWRIAGATLMQSWFSSIPKAARPRAARFTGLLLRLVPGEAADQELLSILCGFWNILSEAQEDMHDGAECLAALRTLSVLGLDAGPVPGTTTSYDAEALGQITADRSQFIARINRGIAASGL